MYLTRDEMCSKLNDLLVFISKNKRLSSDLIKALKQERNMVVGAPSIVLMQRPVTDLSVEEMFWIVSITENMLNIPDSLSLTIAKTFTSKEIQKYKESKFKYFREEIYPVVFDNLIKIADDQWLGVISTQRIFELYKKQFINYNSKTQRPLKRVVTNGGVINYKITKNQASVKEIKEELLKGLFIPNCLTLNLNNDNPDLDFEEDGTKIIINSGNVDLLDGFHRYSAIIEIMLERPDFDLNFGVWLMNFSEEKANRYIYQEDKRNKINKQHIEANQAGSYFKRIAQIINESQESLYYGEFIKYNKAGIPFDKALIIMSKTIKCDSRKEVSDIGNEYIEIMNALFRDGIDVRNKPDYYVLVYFTGLWLVYTQELDLATLVNKIKNCQPKNGASVSSCFRYLREA